MEEVTTLRVTLATIAQKAEDSNRRLESLEKCVDEKVVHVDAHESLEERVAAVEDTFKWLVRTIIGAILLAGLAFLGLGKKVGVL